MEEQLNENLFKIAVLHGTAHTTKQKTSATRIAVSEFGGSPVRCPEDLHCPPFEEASMMMKS